MKIISSILEILIVVGVAFLTTFPVVVITCYYTSKLITSLIIFEKTVHDQVRFRKSIKQQMRSIRESCELCRRNGSGLSGSIQKNVSKDVFVLPGNVSKKGNKDRSSSDLY